MLVAEEGHRGWILMPFGLSGDPARVYFSVSTLCMHPEMEDHVNPIPDMRVYPFDYWVKHCQLALTPPEVAWSWWTVVELPVFDVIFSISQHYLCSPNLK